jgi:hypothetical protein
MQVTGTLRLCDPCRERGRGEREATHEVYGTQMCDGCFGGERGGRPLSERERRSRAHNSGQLLTDTELVILQLLADGVDWRNCRDARDYAASGEERDLEGVRENRSR